MIHLDTNFLIAIEDPSSRAARACREWLTAGETLAVDSLVWTEFCCGPAATEKVRALEAMLASIEPFLAADAAVAARLFNRSGRRRGTLMDCMIAAVAIRLRAPLATLNRGDFERLESFGLVLAPWDR